MLKAGEYLKNIREEKGYSIEQVSKSTKISTPVIRALEEGRLDNVDPVYLKGFLKLYCRFLGIAWEDFLKEYPLPLFNSSTKFSSERAKRFEGLTTKETPKSNAYSHKPEGNGLASHSQSHKPEGNGLASHSQSQKEVKEKSRASGRPSLESAFILNYKKNIFIVLLIIAFSLSLALAYKGFVFVKERIPKLQFSLIKPKSQSMMPSKKSLQKKENKHFKSPPILPKKPPQPDISKVKVQASGSVKETKPKAITVVVRAQKDNFLKVKVDAQMVYQGVLRKGKAESWTAKEKIELSIADAGAVVLEIDGKIFSSLGKQGQPIKNILINSEGLKVE